MGRPRTHRKSFKVPETTWMEAGSFRLPFFDTDTDVGAATMSASLRLTKR
jgi:hypothetical protein